jgi:hypothetical protein
VAAVVDAELSSLAADEEEATEEEMTVDAAVLVAEAVVGVVEATDVAAVIDAEVSVDAPGVLEACAAVSGREEVGDAVSVAAG